MYAPKLKRIRGILNTNPSLLMGGIICFSIVTMAIGLPMVYRVDPHSQDIAARLLPPVWLPGGTSAHPLGTDQLGRDMLARNTCGARLSLLIGVTSVMSSGTLGTLIGLFCGYYNGVAGSVIMRVAEIQMAFPFIILAIMFMALLPPSPVTVIVVFTFSGWPLYSKVARGLTLAAKQEGFVESGRAIGCTDRRILFVYILKNILSSMIVLATLQLSIIILAEAALSFVGIGLQPPTASWGIMLSEGKEYLSIAWWLPTFPGLALMLTGLGINLLGDGLRDVLDPTLRLPRG